MIKPRPVLSRQGLSVECPECERPMLYAESVNHAHNSRRCSWDGDTFTTTKLRCTSCASSVTVETTYGRLRDVDLRGTLAERAAESLRDPEQEMRNKAAAELDTMARELQAKAARVRKGELP